ncbi:sterol esterase 2 [Podospora conica]|nr:sterol esterase 2 [Schizothecium conicum]
MKITTSPPPAPSPDPKQVSLSVGQTAVDFAQHAEKLSHHPLSPAHPVSGVAVEAKFVTPRDAVLVTSEGSRLPGVPLQEAHKLNALRSELEANGPVAVRILEARNGQTHAAASAGGHTDDPSIPIPPPPRERSPTDGTLGKAMPPMHTSPLFPPLPLYGPPSLLRDVQCAAFRVSSFFLSLAFLAVIVLGSLFTSVGPWVWRGWMRATGRDPDRGRPFYREELRRKAVREEEERKWKRGVCGRDEEGKGDGGDGYVPTEGGPDPVVCDVGYYARRVGLDVEKHEVQTEDGFVIDLWHVYDPREYTPLPEEERAHRPPELFTGATRRPSHQQDPKPRFPVLLMHGLLQSSGAYCVNDDDSLAFFLCKSGYDVWLGNNRCGFTPKHVLLRYSDPRMWCWNIRQMGVFDLAALTSRVLYETGFAKIGLVAHSQGTTQTFVALAKEQRPELGARLTVFCALAPAVYAGPLIGKMYFKFMRVISPYMFRLMFGIHAFIPFMMTMHRLLDGRTYGWLGYRVFSFLFNWTDERWDRGLRDRMFRFAPVYVSAESMRWWLGRECFAKHKCILSTKEEWREEEREDREQERRESVLERADRDMAGDRKSEAGVRRRKPKGARAWYNDQAPPFALWICGNDCLVDGDKLLRRFERGREPHVQLVHHKVIEGYEHLDVIWAMDAVDQVFKEVREVLWKTCNVRDVCRVPRDCEDVEEWAAKENDRDESDSSSSDE